MNYFTLEIGGAAVAVAAWMSAAGGVVEPQATADAFARGYRVDRDPQEWEENSGHGRGLATAFAEAHAGMEKTGYVPPVYDAMAMARVVDDKVKAYAFYNGLLATPDTGEGNAQASWLSKWRVTAVGAAPGTKVSFDFGVSFQGKLQLEGERDWWMTGTEFLASAKGSVTLTGAGTGTSEGSAMLNVVGDGDSSHVPDFTLTTTGAWVGKTSGDPSSGLVTLNYSENLPVVATMGDDLWINMGLEVVARNTGGERVSLADFYNSGGFTFPTTGTVFGTGEQVSLNFQFVPEPTGTAGLAGLGLLGWAALRRCRRSRT